MLHELNGKRLELIKEVVPKLNRVAILGDRHHQNYKVQMNQLEAAAKVLGLQLQPAQVSAPNDLTNAFAEMARDRAQALLIPSNRELGFYLDKVVNFAMSQNTRNLCNPRLGGCRGLDVLCS